VNTGLGFVEVVRRASEMPELPAENTKVIDNVPSEVGKFYRRWERLPGSDAEDDVIGCCGGISTEPDNWALS